VERRATRGGRGAAGPVPAGGFSPLAPMATMATAAASTATEREGRGSKWLGFQGQCSRAAFFIRRSPRRTVRSERTAESARAKSGLGGTPFCWPRPRLRPGRQEERSAALLGRRGPPCRQRAWLMDAGRNGPSGQFLQKLQKSSKMSRIPFYFFRSRF
jgi:hypothetical protein